MLNSNSLLVSIIIPCYNVAAYLARAIDSALGQTYPNTEIICVDNNSTDETLAILEGYAKRYPEQIQLFVETKRGAPAARNRGLRAARGEWIQFLDADDELLPKKIERQIDLLRTTDDVEVVVGAFKVQRVGGKREVIVPMNAANRFLPLMVGRSGNTVANLFKATCFKAYGAWAENQPSSQEYELMFRWLKHGAKVLYANFIGCHVYQRPQSISAGNVQAFAAKMELRRAIYDYVSSTQQLSEELMYLFDAALLKCIRDYALLELDKGCLIFQRYFANKHLEPEMFHPERVFKVLISLFSFRRAVCLYGYYRHFRSLT